MSGIENGAGLTAYTVQSRWIGEYTNRYSNPEFDHVERLTMRQPYRRIVGLLTPEGEDLWAPRTVPYDSTSEFVMEEARPEVLPLDEVQSERAVVAFRNFLADGSRKSVKYSCEDFLSIMSGYDRFREDLAPSIVENGTPAQENLAAGQPGVFGYLEGGEKPVSLHAVIGLGEDRPECLQIMYTLGHMGIASYDSLFRLYRKRTGGLFKSLREVTRLGLYTVEAAEVAAGAAETLTATLAV